MLEWEMSKVRKNLVRFYPTKGIEGRLKFLLFSKHTLIKQNFVELLHGNLTIVEIAFSNKKRTNFEKNYFRTHVCRTYYLLPDYSQMHFYRNFDTSDS
jgi:hypothetical protein